MAKKWPVAKIADHFHRSRSWAFKWLGRYKALGLQGLFDSHRSGRPTKLTGDQAEYLVTRIENGARETDSVAVFRGRYLQYIIASELNVKYALSSVYDVLHRLNFTRIKPRPQHEKNDKTRMEQWKNEELPKKFSSVAAANPEKKIDIWFQDEMRFGNKTRISSQWRLRGTSWTIRKQIGYRNEYIYGAVCPRTGEHIGLVFPECSTEVMNIHLSLISQRIEPDTHIILIMDQAGWHSSSKELLVPANISILDLPPYSPELNPVERLWLWIKENHLSNRFISAGDDLTKIGCEAWNKLTNEIVKSICHERYLAFTNFS